MKKNILVAVAWPYVNGPMHIGHLAGAYVAADIFARFQRAKGNAVLMVSGSDMHGTPTAVIAEQEGVAPIEVAERYHKRMSDTLKKIDASFDLYTKTSTETHKQVTQQIFLTLLEKGYIFKDTMMQTYCEHDQRFLPDRFVEGTCPHCKNPKARGDQCDRCGRTLDPKDLIDPKCKFCGTRPIEKETEHFFLDLPQFTDQLLDYLKDKSYWRSNAQAFPTSWIKEGLKARPITRDMKYGIPVPLDGYEDKVIYVWFEAVIGYLSASIEWSETTGNSWETFWKNPENSQHYYFMGKDNVPFHTIIWPAELMGYDATLNLPYNVVATENLGIEGEKMSKSTGRYIEADYLIDTYGSDQVRYAITAFMPETSDSDFTWKSFIGANNNELVATFGNFVNRTSVFLEKNFGGIVPEGKIASEVQKAIDDAFSEVTTLLDDVRFQQAIHRVMKLAQFANKYFDEQKPWANKDTTAANTLFNSVQLISSLGSLFAPFLPKTREKLEALVGNKLHKWEYIPIPSGTKLTPIGLLFEKIDEEHIEQERAAMQAKFKA